MNEREIQVAIYRRFNAGIHIPNWTPPKWWECDVARIMPSGRWHEYEIKISKSDFLADQKKVSESGWGMGRHSKIKHLELHRGAKEGPNHFWYVLPESVAAEVELPSFAGLIIASKFNGRIFVNQKKAAPVLHKEKAAFPVPEMNVFYYRMWTGMERLVNHRAA